MDISTIAIIIIGANVFALFTLCFFNPDILQEPHHRRRPSTDLQTIIINAQ